MVAYWELAAHSAYDMFSKYKYLIVNLFFPPRFLKWEFLSDCATSRSLPTCTFFFSVTTSDYIAEGIQTQLLDPICLNRKTWNINVIEVNLYSKECH